MESIHSQINLFLVKSTYESVSNIQHQNGAYIYGKKALRIEEDMKSLTVGLEALCGIEVERQKLILEQKRKQEKEELENKEKTERELREKKDKKLNMGLIMFGFLTVISITIDALNLVDWFISNGKTMECVHGITLGIIVILTVLMIGFVIFINRKKS